MNGTGIKGGAFGFRVSSINKVCSLFVLILISALTQRLAGGHEIGQQYNIASLLGEDCQ